MNTQELTPVKDGKPIWKSKTMIGTAIMMVSAFVPAVAPIAENWNEIGALIGGALAIFGRLKADKRITSLFK